MPSSWTRACGAPRPRVAHTEDFSPEQGSAAGLRNDRRWTSRGRTKDVPAGGRGNSHLGHKPAPTTVFTIEPAAPARPGRTGRRRGSPLDPSFARRECRFAWRNGPVDARSGHCHPGKSQDVVVAHVLHTPQHACAAGVTSGTPLRTGSARVFARSSIVPTSLASAMALRSPAAPRTRGAGRRLARPAVSPASND